VPRGVDRKLWCPGAKVALFEPPTIDDELVSLAFRSRSAIAPAHCSAPAPDPDA
jgi:hypothetical protein